MRHGQFQVLCCAVWIIAFLPLIRSKCTIREKIIRCHSTSIDDYVSDILRVDQTYSGLEISNSNFSKIDQLILPLVRNIETLSITHSNVTAVGIDLFRLCAAQLLDFSHNQLETFNFTDRSGVLRILNLSHNKIYTLDVVANYLTSLNVGFNRLEQLTRLPNGDYSTLNLEHNPLKAIAYSRRLTVDRLILFGLNVTQPLLDNITRAFRMKNLLMSNTTFPGVAVIDHLQNELHGLDLSYNFIKSIDNVLQKNVKVQYLNLSHNHIGTVAPKHAKDVQELDLSFNRLRLTNGSFDRWNVLSALNLANCSLESVRKEVFRGLDSLLRLNLSRNLLRSLEADCFKTVPRLTTLDLSGNRISRLESYTFAELPRLEFVDVSENRISEIKQSAFYMLSALSTIRIARNNAFLWMCDGAIRKSFALQHLDLSGSALQRFPSKFSPILPDLPFTEYCASARLTLSLRGNSDNQSSSFCHFQELFIVNSTIPVLKSGSFKCSCWVRVLDIKSTTVDKVEQCALCGLFFLERFDAKCIFARTRRINSFTFKDLRRVPVLDLSAIGLHNIEARAFDGMTQLNRLDLSDNNITALTANVFDGLTQLRHLLLANSSIRHCSPNAFFGLKQLRSLNLSHNELETLQLGTFQHFPSLRVLLLNGNKLVEFEVGIFSNLPFLEELYMAHNDISTILVESLMPLKNLRILDLQHNNLKKLDHTGFNYLNNFQILKIAMNKFRCVDLKNLMIAMGSKISTPAQEETNYYKDNIGGVDCIDVCKYILCLKDSHGNN